MEYPATYLHHAQLDLELLGDGCFGRHDTSLEVENLDKKIEAIAIHHISALWLKISDWKVAAACSAVALQWPMP